MNDSFSNRLIVYVVLYNESLLTILFYFNCSLLFFLYELYDLKFAKIMINRFNEKDLRLME